MYRSDNRQALATPATTLRVGTRVIDVNGRPATVFGLTQPDGSHGLITEAGRRFYGFSQDAVVEARKVVWPTRKETLQMTGVVLVFVIVMAFFLWMVDGVLSWIVHYLMGRGG